MGLFLAMHDTDTDVAMAYHESGSISHVVLSRAHLEREERRETQETGDYWYASTLRLYLCVCTRSIIFSLSLSLNSCRVQMDPQACKDQEEIQEIL